MPDGIGYGDNSIERLVKLATDPLYDEPVPTDVGALTQGVPQPGAPAPSMGYQVNPSYADGGVVSAPPQPAPQAGLAPQGGAAPRQMTLEQMEPELQRLMQEQPQVIAQIAQELQRAMQTGELTKEELNTFHQVAIAAAQNPQLWPQLRQFVIQQGVAEPDDLPEHYEQGLVFVMLLATRSVMGSAGGQIPQSDGQPAQATMKQGGPVPHSNNADGSVKINAHKGEYIIPEHIVLQKGTDFFDKMVGKDKEASA